MKAQILKIAGVKSEKEFYKKFPTEKEFMAKYGKEFKKAQNGLDQLAPYNPADFIARDENAPALMQNRGTTFPTALRDNKLAPVSSQVIPGRNDGKGFWEGASNVFGPMNKAGKYVGPASQIAEGVSGLIEEGKQKKSAQQSAAVSDLSLQASRTMPEKTRRQYVRPEDTRNTGEEFFPVYGVGTNPLAKDGKTLKNKVKGNKTEIQNTYSPRYTLYTDLEELPKAFDGFSGFMGAGGSDFATNIAGGLTDNNAGFKTGKGVGNALKMIPGVGPVVGAVAAPILGAVGGALDNLVGPAGKIKKANARTDSNMQSMAFASGAQGVQGQYGSNMEYGGDLNPQVIKRFGEYDLSELLAPDRTMDTLRAGGHLKEYTNPSERSLQTYAMGGDLKVYKGGTEQISTNPYLPNGGETVMFRGPSHEDGGMPISYGKSGVEVEGGEPAQVLEDGTGEDDALTVFGNLKINNQFLPLLGDSDAKGKKFKNYIANLSTKEKKATTILDKTTDKLADLKPQTSFDKITMASFNANIQGSNMKLKELADKKMNAAHLQNAINDTAKEHGLVAEHLANGKIMKDKNAEFGGKFTEAKDGDREFKTAGINSGSIDYNPISTGYNPDYWNSKENYKKNWMPKVNAAFDDPKRAIDLVSRIENYGGQDFADVRAAIAKGKTPEQKIAIARRLGTDEKVGPYHKLLNGLIDNTAQPSSPMMSPRSASIVSGQTPPKVSNELMPMDNVSDASYQTKTEFPWMGAINAALPYFRSTNQERLDPNQLMGEMYAMSSNQLEPVKAQGYHPQLDVPYDISLQDVMNENQADYRSAQRNMGYNPAAQANLNAQKYAANQKVLGEQFRMNQAEKDKVYGKNRDILNDAQLKNLGIYDQQYTRQAEALSNTKATTQAALNSISDKYAKNKLENRTLGVYENLYNYRYDRRGRAINENPLQQWDTTVPGGYDETGMGTVGNNDYERTAARKEAYDTTERRDIHRMAKRMTPLQKRNGAIVKALKYI